MSKRRYTPTYPAELRERGVRLFREHRGEYASDNAAYRAIAPKLGCSPDSLRVWCQRAERDAGERVGPTTAEKDRIKELERENRELRQANEILMRASAYFAAAELDRPFRNTRALKQEVVHVPMPEGYFAHNNKCLSSDSDIALYCRPEKSDHLLIGSEDPPCDGHVWVDDPYDENSWRHATEQSSIQAMRLAQRAPTIGIPNNPKAVVDLYDVSDDWIPIYDKSSLPGFYMACGSSGNQFKNAPMAGKMMAALLEYADAGNDHDQDPLSIKMDYTGLDLNIGFFSRKRPINEDSSFSVLG